MQVKGREVPQPKTVQSKSQMSSKQKIQRGGGGQITPQ